MSELAEKEKGGQGHGHLVTVTVDSVPKQIRQGRYRVAELKTLLGVSPELELDEVIDGEFRPLDDNSELNVKEGDVFVSHVRRGGAS
jgi:hypothetical protein